MNTPPRRAHLSRRVERPRAQTLAIGPVLRHFDGVPQRRTAGLTPLHHRCRRLSRERVSCHSRPPLALQTPVGLGRQPSSRAFPPEGLIEPAAGRDSRTVPPGSAPSDGNTTSIEGRAQRPQQHSASAAGDRGLTPRARWRASAAAPSDRSTSPSWLDDAAGGIRPSPARRLPPGREEVVVVRRGGYVDALLSTRMTRRRGAAPSGSSSPCYGRDGNRQKYDSAAAPTGPPSTASASRREEGDADGLRTGRGDWWLWAGLAPVGVDAITTTADGADVSVTVEQLTGACLSFDSPTRMSSASVSTDMPVGPHRTEA